MPKHSLTAQELIDCWQDVQTVALATVTTRGEPRIPLIGNDQIPIHDEIELEMLLER